ncbi:DNA polymerase [Lactococcus garvieae]|uniref:DNA polymerase n=1 Tax=Lactococcus garvieae TaxID=1363 RepID=UPI00385348A2
MRTVSVDIETFSSVNLQKSGVYRYVESDDFEILLFAYSVDGGPVDVIDLASGETIPDEILKAIVLDDVIKWAFNATFERVCLSRYLGLPTGTYLDSSSWRCSMIWAATLGLPLSLEGVGAVLGLDKQKLSEGKSLIRYFCVPCQPTKINGGRTRNLPHHDEDKWAEFKSYNIRDVEVELSIQNKLAKFPVLMEIWNQYQLDQAINDRGILVDMVFADEAIRIDELSRNASLSRLQKLTGLENPNSVLQLREWLWGKGCETPSLDKKSIVDLLKSTDGQVHEVLSLRQELAKSSVKKYMAMENYAGSDNRARGLFQFMGANRTGRFAGRGIQLQNLPQNHMSDLADARSLVKQGNHQALELLYDSTTKVLSELIRTAFIPRDGMKFIVADFSAIEARIIAWLAGEDWRLDVFQNGGDIYCASASQMFGVPVVKHGVNGELRQKGKVAELALGYGGSVGALTAMGALDMGLSEGELQPLVTSWRETNPNITKLWWSVDRAVKDCVKSRGVTNTHGIKFIYQSGFLFIQLPSNRRLAYVKPQIGMNKFGGESVTYEGIGLMKKWERIDSYGPKFVENIVQAIARDILCYAIEQLKNYRIVAHVHDEIIIEADVETSVKEVSDLMCQRPSWANDLQLDADGYECMFYQKD